MATQSFRTAEMWEHRAVGLYRCENIELWEHRAEAAILVLIFLLFVCAPETGSSVMFDVGAPW